MKRWLVQATFPELKGGVNQQSARVEASAWWTAVYRAAADFNGKLYRLKFTTVELRITRLPDKEDLNG